MDYEQELYAPIRASALNNAYEIVLPHEKGADAHTKDVIRSSGFVFAEVSHPATGVGIELGWADAFGIPIICLHKKGVYVSGSLRYVTNHFLEYTDGDDLVRQMSVFLSQRV
jgi:hypothetical protein